jgi:hypothetical protein
VRSRVESLAARQADGARRAAGVVTAATAADPVPAEASTAVATKPTDTAAKPTDTAAAEGEEETDRPMRESAQAEATHSTAEQGLRASDGTDYDRPAPPEGVSPIGSLTKPVRAVVQGRVHAVEIRPVEHSTVLACDVADSTGELTALFYGRSRIPGVICGSRVRFRGSVGIRADRPFMVNPTYELLASGPPEPGDRRSSGDGGAST